MSASDESDSGEIDAEPTTPEPGEADATDPQEPDAAAADTETGTSETGTSETGSGDGTDTADDVATAAQFPVTVTDALGTDFTFDEPPRLGCVSFRCREILAGFGVAPAASSYRESEFFFPVGPPDFEVVNVNDIEAWAGADVDVAVFGGVPEPPITYQAIDRVVPILYLQTPGLTNDGIGGIEAIVGNTRLLGQITGEVDAAERDIARLEAAIATASPFSTPELSERTFVMLTNAAGYIAEFIRRPDEPENAFCAALDATGLGECVEFPTQGRELSAEAFLDLDPDVIVMADGQLSVDTRDDPTWQRLRAVVTGSVYDSARSSYRNVGVRSLIWALQEYVSATVPDSGVPAPGPLDDFDPTSSPLVTGDI
ncbi:MAG: ABC transporter substrate-binding protein [Actinomycetota bacterium]